MSYNFQPKIVKTRKKHRCVGCNEIIEIGTKVMKYSGVSDGKFYNSYMCDACEEFSKTECMKCRTCWDIEVCFDGYIKECKIEMGWGENDD